MTALTQERDTARQGTEMVRLPVAAGKKIFAGAIVCIAAGYAVPGATDAGLIYVGRAEETVDNSAGGNGDAFVDVRRGSAFKFANDASAPVAAAHLFTDCYIVDDQTVSSSHATNTRSKAGTVIALDGSGVWVE